MFHEKTALLEMNILKRNKQVVAFNEIRIKRAIGNAFKEERNLPREVELPIDINQSVEKATQGVVSVVRERLIKGEQVTVEEVQDEVIRQLFENGFKAVGELYANYRKQHAQRRTLFELYSITKRDGKVVSFKPEKITFAIAKAFRAYNRGILTETLLGIAHEISNTVMTEIQTLWPTGKCINIEEIQDLVENHLMKSSYHEIAKSFILYREERAKQRRREHLQSSVDSSNDFIKDVSFKTKEGKDQNISFKEIRFQLETCCQGLEAVSADDYIKRSCKELF